MRQAQDGDQEGTLQMVAQSQANRVAGRWSDECRQPTFDGYFVCSGSEKKAGYPAGANRGSGS